MKKTVLLLLACASSALAWADASNPCNLPVNPPPPIIYNDFLSSKSLGCVPWPYYTDTSTPMTVTTTPGGLVAWWYCKGSDGKWGHSMSAATNEELAKPGYLSSLSNDLIAAVAASGPQAGMDAVAATRINTLMSDPKLAAVWCPIWPMVYNAIPGGRLPVPSADGTLVPPAASLIDATGAAWAISNGFATRNGVATNGHAVKVLTRAGSVYVLSPTGGYWWKWLGPNMWQRLTTTQP